MRDNPVMRLNLGLHGSVDRLPGRDGDAGFVDQLRVSANDEANADALAVIELLVSACLIAHAWVGLDLFLTARRLGDRAAQYSWIHPSAWYKFGCSVPLIRCAVAAQSAQLIEIRQDNDGHYVVPTQKLVDLLLAIR